MADPTILTNILEVATVPVMAKARIGHFAEAQILEYLGAHCPIVLTKVKY